MEEDEKYLIVSRIYSALKVPNRIKTLESIADGKNLTEISRELNISYAGTQSYKEDLNKSGLIITCGNRYEITEMGKYMLENYKEIAETYNKNVNIDEEIEKFTTLIDKNIPGGINGKIGKKILEKIVNGQD